VADRSPAEAYRQARRRSARPALAAFTGELSFELDPFQWQACESLEGGHGVLVCAPTGAGKTVVGEFAVHLALRASAKCFYTTPIKALSNQKYADLVERYDEDTVGLLTGDIVINGDAPIVVMTTEVLRNMLYADASAIAGLDYVVMDEVHYLADRFRGPVWEEVILQLPERVHLVSLSATVSNAEEFGEWLVAVRGDTAVVVAEHRPVPLFEHVLVGGRLMDLFAGEDTEDTEGTAKINPRLLRRTEEIARTTAPAYRRGADRRGPRRGRAAGADRGPRPQRFRPPSRVDVLHRLDSRGLLPAIVFIFSRAGCHAAVESCARAGVRLTGHDEVDEIRKVVDVHTAGLPEADLEALGYWEWRDALERGVAEHHAGLLPAFKETVEELFVSGLVKVVFATETLALGINMPARTVVLERLVKYNGEAHVGLTPGEYTQLTGRAGRRGIDVEGHAVVLWSPGMNVAGVAGLASTRTYPLRSSFRPGYNMTVNLVATLGPESARAMLEESFAQFQADRSVVGSGRAIERNENALGGYMEAMRCDYGDFAEYFELRCRITERERELVKRQRGERRAEAAASLETLRKGDVIALPSGKHAGLAVVVDSQAGAADERLPVVVTQDRWGGALAPADVTAPVESLGKLTLPKQVHWRSPKVRRDLASSLANTGIEARGHGRTAAGRDGSGAEPGEDPDAELASLRKALRGHPCHGCPDREAHARWAERHRKLARETAEKRRRVAETTHSLARQFDRIRALLVERDYLAEEGQRQVTARGEWLARIYSESDLLAAECLREGAFSGLDPAELAASVSTLVFETRREGSEAAPVPGGAVADAVAAIRRLWSELEADERRHKLSRTREPDAGFVWPVYRWARGESLEAVLDAAGEAAGEVSAGDFVRWCRQVADLLDQLRRVLGGDDPLAASAAAAISGLRRGVVAAGAM
jgi:ATP-dependent RNA helicase HelY